MRKIRGKEISMIFQEPMTSLNPVFTVGEQIAEAIRLHEGLGRRDAMAKTVDMLKLVHIPNAERRVKEYPHQLSGGMRQRIMIAMALSCNPKLLIADEPTTALDVTIQAQILELLNELKAKLGMAILLITHDMGVIAETAQRVIVMYGAQVVEAPSPSCSRPLHPYTQGLLRSIPGSIWPPPRSRSSRRSPARCRRCAATSSRAAASRRAARSPSRCILTTRPRSRKSGRATRWPASSTEAQPCQTRCSRSKISRSTSRSAAASLAGGRPSSRRRRRVLRHHARRDARAGRRVGLQEIDDGPRFSG